MKQRFVFAAALALSPLFSAVHAAPPPQVNDPSFARLARPTEQGDGKWVGNAGVGLTLTRGNTNTTSVSFNGEATRAMRHSRVIGRILAIRNSSDGAKTAELGNIELRGERNFDKTLFGFGDVLLERDINNDLSARKSLSFGVGRHFVDTEYVQFNAYVGLAYVMADYYKANDGRGVEPLIGEELALKLSDTSKFSQRLVIFPNTVGAGGMRAALQADITTRITDKLGLQLAMLGKYRAHVTDFQKHGDITIFTGLTASF